MNWRSYCLRLRLPSTEIRTKLSSSFLSCHLSWLTGLHSVVSQHDPSTAYRLSHSSSQPELVKGATSYFADGDIERVSLCLPSTGPPCPTQSTSLLQGSLCSPSVDTLPLKLLPPVLAPPLSPCTPTLAPVRTPILISVESDNGESMV